MEKFVFINSHPIQYFIPLYQQMYAAGIPIEVLYCSSESVEGKIDKGFGVAVKWDIPLLNGYPSRFLKNSSWKPSIHTGFWGLINWEVVEYFRSNPKSIIIVNGWSNFTNVLAILFGTMLGHTVCIRAETPLHQEKLKSKFKTKIKHLYLQLLFSFIKFKLYIGKQNRAFYKSFNIPEHSLIFTPYCIDNHRFQEVYNRSSKYEVRVKLGLPLDVPIVLYSGKYIDKKRPLDLLIAFNALKSNAFLVMVGDGDLKPVMNEYIRNNNLEDRVLLTGFVNQSLIPYYYAASDIFVMCSGLGETWGLSVNEAMNFSLPIVVSETTGCSYDLVQHNGNGFVFETGNIKDLTIHLSTLVDNKDLREKMGLLSRSIIDGYSYKVIIDNLLGLYTKI